METTPPAGAADLEIERTLNATPERVFDAFTQPDALKAWFGPGGCQVIRADVDLRTGGRYRIRMTTESFGEVEVVGEYRTVERPERLAFTWRWQDNPELEPSDSVVELQFLAEGKGTRLRLRHIGLPTEENRENHSVGWNGSFDRLEKHFA